MESWYITTWILCFGISTEAAFAGAFFLTTRAGEEARATSGEDFVKKLVMLFWFADCFFGVRKGTEKKLALQLVLVEMRCVERAH